MSDSTNQAPTRPEDATAALILLDGTVYWGRGVGRRPFPAWQSCWPFPHPCINCLGGTGREGSGVRGAALQGETDAPSRQAAGYLLALLLESLGADALATQLASADGRMRLNRKPF